jgi:hypothetical protein
MYRGESENLPPQKKHQSKTEHLEAATKWNMKASCEKLKNNTCLHNPLKIN